MSDKRLVTPPKVGYGGAFFGKPLKPSAGKSEYKPCSKCGKNTRTGYMSSAGFIYLCGGCTDG